MRYQQWMLAAVLGAAMLPGCKKEEPVTTPANDTAPAARNNTTEINPTAPKAQPETDLPKTTDNAVNSAVNSAKQGVNNAIQGANTAVGQAKESANGAATDTKGAGVMDATAAEAQKKLDQVVEYVKENKLDLADKGLKELEQNQASLPTVVKDQLPTVRKTIDAAKAGNATGLKLPQMNK